MPLLHDLRFALRLMWKDRWLTAAAVSALALGIGLNTTVFTFVNAVLVRGLPFPEPDRILHVDSQRLVGDRDHLGVSYLDWQDWRRDTTAFEDLGAWSGGAMNISEPGHLPERLSGARVSANTFRLLRQQPLLGRDFVSGEDRNGSESVVILGYGMWQERYGGDPNVLGRVIRIDEEPCTIVGVMPEGMQFPTNARLWRPLVLEAADKERDDRRLNVFGRLKPGVSQAQAQAELAVIARALAKQYPQTNKETTVVLSTFNERFNGGSIRLVFLSLMGAVGFVLLIACANVANLLLSRSVQRTREIAVRVALGASRWRIIQQLLAESVLLAFLGGALGLGLAAIGVRLFDQAVSDVGKPYWIVFSMDWKVFTFLVAVCVATGVVFGLAPAFQVSRTKVTEALKEGGRGQAGGPRARRFTSVMVVSQIALTLVLLTGAGLMVRSFFKLYRLDLGIDGSPILTMRLNPSERRYPDEDARRQFYDRLAKELDGVGGAASVTFASHPPVGGAMRRRLEIDGRTVGEGERLPEVSTVLVGDRYFATLGLTLWRGRDFGPRDGLPGAEATIVSERFVARFFSNEDPLGRRIRLTAGEEEPGRWLTIVGVSPTIRQAQVHEIEPDAVVYLPYRLEPAGFTTLLARARGEPSILTTPLRRAVQSIDADLPVHAVYTFDALLARSRWPYRVFGTMFALFALIGLLLSSVGIYAVMAYAVSQRRQEIGIRIALGAGSSRVALGMLRGGLLQLAVGLALGLAGAYGVSRLLESLLVQTTSTDPLTFGTIIALLSAVTIVACLLPARRAARVDPIVALRAE
ncbi:MAG: FtsX-like permease family protein [Luteitalea sp.]|nr:FtsX-like permease family protein [Luteitalea sp.]